MSRRSTPRILPEFLDITGRIQSNGDMLKAISSSKTQTGASLKPYRLIWIQALLFLFIAIPPSQAVESEELLRLVKAWPGNQSPFSEWRLVSQSLNEGEIRFMLQHKESGEHLDLVARKHDPDKPAFSKSRLYNLFYHSHLEQAHTSPEADRLLPAWVEWIRRNEGEATVLLPYGEAEKIRKAREADRLSELDAARKAARELREKQRKYGVARLIGKIDDWKPGESVLEGFLVLMLLAWLLFLFPKINRYTWIIREKDERLLRRFLGWPVFIGAVSYGYMAWRAFPKEEVGIKPMEYLGITPSPGFMDYLLISRLEALGEMAPVVFGVTLGLLFLVVAIYAALVSFALFWDSITPLFVTAAYLIWRFLAGGFEESFPSLMADGALAVAFLALVHQAHGHERAWRLAFAATAMTLAVWLDPAIIVIVGFYFAYVLIETSYREETLSYPLTWIVPIFTLLFSAPVFMSVLGADRSATLPGLFFGGWSDISAKSHVIPWSLLITVFLVAIGGLFFSHKSFRTMTLLLLGLYASAILLALGLAGLGDSYILTGRTGLLPALLVGISLRRLAGKELRMTPE